MFNWTDSNSYLLLVNRGWKTKEMAIHEQTQLWRQFYRMYKVFDWNKEVSLQKKSCYHLKQGPESSRNGWIEVMT